jgi:tetrahydromethanopterin S-methyltransferase subunit G
MNKNELTEFIREVIDKLNEDNATSGGEAYNSKYFLSKRKLNEISYRSFNNDISKVTPKTKMNKALNNINKRLKEINQIIDYTNRLNEGDNNINTNPSKMDNIKNQLREINKKLNKFK